MANPMGKTRPVDNPYLTVVDDRFGPDGWTTKVLKAYSADPDKPYARVFTDVKTIYTGGGSDMGDTYWTDITGRIVQRDPVVTDDLLPHHLRGA